VKNCGARFHTRIAQKDFLKDLVNIINPKYNPPTIVRERILGLIQYWADAFKSNPEYNAVSEMYQQLKSEGIEFPPLDLDTYAPINTPNKPESESNQADGVSSSAPSTDGGSSGIRRSTRPIGPLKPEQVAKLLSELDVVRRNLDIMNELLVENEPGSESEDDLLLMQEIYTTLQAMQERATLLIGRVQDEIVMESLLQINDELNSSFTRYDRHMKNRQALKQPSSTAAAPPPSTVTDDIPPLIEMPTPNITYPKLDEDLPPPYENAAVGQLIDLGNDLNTPGPPAPQTTQTNDIMQQLADIGISSQPQPEHPNLQSDEFDMFAQSRMAYSTGGSTYEDNLQEQGTSIASALNRLPQPPAVENQYETVGQWMDVTNLQPTQQKTDQASSAEFDQFLADRASKGSRHRPQMQTQEEVSDELFQL
jgi:hypothetical protein